MCRVDWIITLSELYQMVQKSSTELYNVRSKVYSTLYHSISTRYSVSNLCSRKGRMNGTTYMLQRGAELIASTKIEPWLSRIGDTVSFNL